MAPKKSVFRGPNAQHFQLVHRSQRDPLINDPDVGQRVLKPVGRANDRKNGYTLAELDASLDKSTIRQNEGEAALYGIAYDDSSYDYMAHLKALGGLGGGGDSFLIPGPRGSGIAKGMMKDRKGKGKATNDLFELDLPASVLPSHGEISERQAWEREANIPEELRGLQPDMDPHLRQVLEALEDDAFVDEEGEEEGWFDELVQDGERGEEEVEFEFREWGLDEGGKIAGGEMGEGLPDGEEGLSDDGEGLVVDEGAEVAVEDWSRVKAFKKEQAEAGPGPVDREEQSELADTIGTLPSNMEDMMVVGGKKRRGKRGPSDATGNSMSSSSMFRNQGLRDLDDRFDRMALVYEAPEDEDDFPDDDESYAPSMMSSMSKASLYSSTSAAPPEVSREDFDNILDDFLENYEIVGRKYKLALGGTGLSGPEKLQVLRAAVEGQEGEGLGKEENRRRIMELEKLGRGVRREPRERIRADEDRGEKWDVETILTQHTNTENHPAVIRTRTIAQARERAAKAALSTVPPPAPARTSTAANGDVDSSDDSGSETEREEPRITVSRPKGETADDRRARKSAVKEERAARRAEKKSHQATFSNERKRQLASHKKLVGNGRAADLSVGARGVVSLS